MMIDLLDEGKGTQLREDRSLVLEWPCSGFSVA
jgi:hypothetical protein